MRRLTSDPADFFGIKDRGRLAPGLAADVAIFDPGTRRLDRTAASAATTCPAAPSAWSCRSRGVEYTVVNGAVTWEDGKLTGATAGQVLRS